MPDWTRQELERQTLQLLREAGNTPGAELATGTGETATITTSDQLGLWFDEATYALATTCFPIWGTGTWAVWAANRQQQQYATAVGRMDVSAGDDNSVLWSPDIATWAGVELEHWDRERLAGAGFNLLAVTSGAAGDTVPLAWYEQGAGMGLYKIPGTSGAVVAYGLMIPPRLAALSTALTWIGEREAFLLCCYAAGKWSLANQDDPIVAARAGIWLSIWDMERQNRWELLPESLRASHYPTPPTPTTPMLKEIQP